MYLVLSDNYFIKGSRTTPCFLCLNENYEKACEAFENLKDLKEELIDEILIYSIARESCGNRAMKAKCSKIEYLPNGIKIHYENIEAIDSTCENVRKRMYGYLCRKGIIKKGDNSQILFSAIVEDINDYYYIKGEKKESKFLSFMQEMELLRQESKWLEIVKRYPKFDEIESSPFWEDEKCLSQLAFALSMLLNKHYSKNDEMFFIKVIDRCINMTPNNISSKSLKAFYYYNKYTNRQLDEFFYVAEELYKELIQTSKEQYKELYRYTKLLQNRFESKQWTGEFGDNWFKETKTILDNFEKLIEDYSSLTEEKQKQYKKYYIRSLFGYSSFSIDILLNYWDIYFDNKIFNYQIKAYLLNNSRLELINKISEYLNKICTICNYENITIDSINEKPNYFDVEYRISQIEQIKGIIYVLLNKKIDEYKKFFEQSNNHIENIFNVANNYRNNPHAKFNYPYYVKLPKAINYFFLNNEKECHNCFYKAKEYMIYEEARIYILQDNKNRAIELLSTIPPKDKCYKKSQKLLDRIKQ